jgi:hypothetical protein
MPVRLTVVKPGKRERDGIGTRPQIDDAVETLCVGDDRAHLLDQAGLLASTVTPAARAGGIAHDAGETALCPRGDRCDQETQENEANVRM